MKPYPLASLNHLTVPCAIPRFPLSLGGGEPPTKSPDHHGRGLPRDRGETKRAPARTRVLTALAPFRTDRFRSRTDQATRQRYPKAAATLPTPSKACQGRSSPKACQGRSSPAPMPEALERMKKAGPPRGDPAFRFALVMPSGLAHVGGLEPLRAPGHLELDPIALGQALEALGLNGAEMHEHVLATLLGNEAVPLRVVEPLDRTLCH